MFQRHLRTPKDPSSELPVQQENRSSITNYNSSEIKDKNKEEGDLIQGVQGSFSGKRSLKQKSATEWELLGKVGEIFNLSSHYCLLNTYYVPGNLVSILDALSLHIPCQNPRE